MCVCICKCILNSYSGSTKTVINVFLSFYDLINVCYNICILYTNIPHLIYTQVTYNDTYI